MWVAYKIPDTQKAFSQKIKVVIYYTTFSSQLFLYYAIVKSVQDFRGGVALGCLDQHQLLHLSYRVSPILVAQVENNIIEKKRVPMEQLRQQGSF